MSTAKKDRKYLMLAGLLPFCLDIALTLAGQPSTYWSGIYTARRELNPIADWILAIHPVFFMLGAVIYTALFSGAIYYSPRVIAWWLSIGLFLAHIGGARTWPPRLTSWEFYSMWDMALNGLAAALATFCYLNAAKNSAIQHARIHEPA